MITKQEAVKKMTGKPENVTGSELLEFGGIKTYEDFTDFTALTVNTNIRIYY